MSTKGTCDTGDNPAAALDIWGWSELESNCALDFDYYSGDYDFDYSHSHRCIDLPIAEGTCSLETEELLLTEACMRSLAEQPNIIKNTLELQRCKNRGIRVALLPRNFLVSPEVFWAYNRKT